jgi:DNA-binding beta-propeller fold protein YncE
LTSIAAGDSVNRPYLIFPPHERIFAFAPAPSAIFFISKMKRAFVVVALITVALSVRTQAGGFAFDHGGNLFFLTANPATIFKFAPNGTTTEFATGEAGSDWLNIAIDPGGNLFVLAMTNNRHGDVVAAILKFTAAGKRSTFIGDAGKGEPTGIAFDSAGNLFIGIATLKSPSQSAVIVKFAHNRTRTMFATDLKTPSHFAFDAAGNLFVFDDPTILKFTPNGTKSTFAKGISAHDLAFDRSGNLFVEDFARNTIVKFDASGTESTFATVTSPWFLAFDAKDNLFVLGYGGIFKFGPDGSKNFFARNPIDRN